MAAMAANPCCDLKELTTRERDEEEEVQAANKRMIQQRIEVKESLRSSVIIKLKTLWSWRKKVENILLLRHLAVIFRLKIYCKFRSVLIAERWIREVVLRLGNYVEKFSARGGSYLWRRVRQRPCRWQHHYP